MRIELYFAIAFNFDISSMSAEIISGKVDKHDMLGIFLQIGGKLPGKNLVFFIISCSTKGAGNRIYIRFTFINLQMGLRRRAENLIITIIKIKQVGRRVY